MNGAAASPHWGATAVGRELIAAGANALDACVAINAMLGVVYPHMCGVGGDLFLLYYEAESGQVHALNGSGRAPRRATPAVIRARGHKTMPDRGPLSVNVPGVVSAWETALERFGSRTLAELLAPAIAAAHDGAPVSGDLAADLVEFRDLVRAEPVLRRRFLDSEGEPLPQGATVRQPELGGTLERIARFGAADFYRGEIADELDRSSRQAGGLLRRDDLEVHQSDWVTPLKLDYRGLEVYTTPPNSQGIAALQILNGLAVLGADRFAPGSVDHIDLLVKAKRVAFADRDRFVSDPDRVPIPVSELLSRERMREALGTPRERAETHPVGGDTVYLCAVDEHGNACSVIQSIYFGFGSGFTAGDTGFLLQNRGHYFSLDDGHANRLEPGKRTLHTLMASLALSERRPRLLFGTMGADGQPQISVQVLERVLEGATPQEAVASPRVLSGRFHPKDPDVALHVEENIGADVIEGLARRGHEVSVVPPRDARLGHAHAILVDGGEAVAGIDPRSDGLRPPGGAP